MSLSNSRLDRNKIGSKPKCSRGYETRKVPKYILIVSEDTKSSCFYFKSFVDKYKGGNRHVMVEACGTARNTLSLVEEAKNVRARKEAERKKEGKLPSTFDQVWVVFDKDDFKDDDFDNAIMKANSPSLGYHVACSNPCFELWYLLHVEDCKTFISRQKIFSKMKDIVPDYEKSFGKTSYESLKGDKGKELHEKMAKCSDEKVKTAIDCAKSLNEFWRDERVPEHARNPSTYVFKLIEELQSLAITGSSTLPTT